MTTTRSKAIKSNKIKENKRIIVLDDHPIVRHGLVKLIEDEDGLEVVAEADNAGDALDLIREHKPDLVVVDLSLKDVSGLELIKQVKSEFEEVVRMLVVSMHDEKIFAERALQAGASGYLHKEEAQKCAVEAIIAVLKGRIYLSRGMMDRFVKRAVNRDSSEVTSTIDTLSDRELEVFELIGRGLNAKRIAEKLHLSPKTVETYRQHIKRKLTLADNSELATRATEWVLCPR